MRRGARRGYADQSASKIFDTSQRSRRLRRHDYAEGRPALQYCNCLNRLSLNAHLNGAVIETGNHVRTPAKECLQSLRRASKVLKSHVYFLVPKEPQRRREIDRDKI